MAKTRIEQTLDYMEIERMQGYIFAYQNNMDLAKSVMADMPRATSEETAALADYISYLAERISVMEGNLQMLRKAYLVNYSDPLCAAVPGFLYDKVANASEMCCCDTTADVQKKKPKKTSGGK